MSISLSSRWWSYAVAVMGIALVFLLGTRGVVQSLAAPGDIALVTNADQYAIGETIIFNGELRFAKGEMATTTAVYLKLSGPQTISTNIPTVTGNHDLSGSFGVQGEFHVEVSFSDVSEIGIGTNIFKGISEGAKILVYGEWTPDQKAGSAGTYRADLSANIEDMDGPLTSTQVHFTIAEDPAPPAGSGGGLSPATKTPTRTPRPTRTAKPTPTQTATLVPTATPSPEPTATESATPTASPTYSPTRTLAPPPSLTPTRTATSTVLPSPTRTATATPAASPSPVPTWTSTPTPPALAVLAADGEAIGLGSEPLVMVTVTPSGSETDVNEQPQTGLRAGVIALVVVGIAVGSGLVAVVGIPFFRG